MLLYYERFWLILAAIPAIVLLFAEGLMQSKMPKRVWIQRELKEYRRFVTKMWKTGNGHAE